MGQVISEALMNLLSVQNLIFVNVGIFIGIIFGAIPGMNGNLAITVLLPFTFQMDTVPALLMLTAIFFGANFGGSISSILINTPGTNAAAATLIDGYPMCRNGQPRRALDMALVASTFGGLVSAFCLLFFAPQISKVAMKFSSPEYFALAIFGLSVIASVSGKSLVKGLISGGLGILLATVGIDSVSGVTRFTFGALDAQTRTQLQTELLETWQREKKTCFFITHDVEEAIILAQTVIIMSARPGRIRDIVKIDIPYPRTQETKMTKEFMELKNEIWSQVYQEYLEVRK